jgi:hypothetical protein
LRFHDRFEQRGEVAIMRRAGADEMGRKFGRDGDNRDLVRLLPSPVIHDRWAQSRSPMDMMVQG